MYVNGAPWNYVGYGLCGCKPWSNLHSWEKAMAPCSSTPAWKIPWMEEPGRLQSTGSLRVKTRPSDFTFTFHVHALEKEMATHSNVLAWRIPGMAEPGGLPSMGSHRVGHNWSDLAAAAATYTPIWKWGSERLSHLSMLLGNGRTRDF